MTVAPPVYPALGANFDLQKVDDHLQAEAKKLLSARRSELGLDLESTPTVVLRSDSPARGVLDYANDNDIDLIVIGTNGHRGFERFMLGSVAEEVVRKSNCPVWTCHPDEELGAQRPERMLSAS